MLEPRESDVPALFLVLVVLPLVAYILLGKWSETVKNRNRITILAHQAAEEALKEEEMTVADVIPPVSSSRSELHVCARCSAPAKTRCSRCKSVRYCSGNCQIIHWRQVHKHECLHLEAHKSNSLLLGLLVDESSYRSGLVYGNVSPQFLGHDLKQTIKEKAPLDNLVHPPIGTVAASPVDCDLSQASVLKKRNSSKSNKQTLRRDNGNIYNSSNESSGYMAGSSPSSSAIPKEAFMRQKSRNDNCPVLEEENASGSSANALINAMFDSDNYQTHQGNSCLQRSNHGCLSLSNAEKKGQVMDEIQVISFKGRNFDEAAQFRCSSEMTTKDTVMVKRISHPPKTKCSRSPKLTSKASVDFCSPEIEKKGQIADESKAVGVTDSLPSQGNNGNMMGLRKSAKLTSLASSEAGGDKCMKIKMLFPYEEFVKLFQSEVVGICPRGLLNCGNSCYANAVLQCLTSTKPLVVYLLYRLHSKTSCVKDWCLMCELEQHIMMLREIGGPLSPSRILRHMRSINCQMGDGSQEDAHEFLRLLIASMQSICLERLGGEKNVAPWLQETTFVQHTFGGRLQSKVTCLKCNHESERYENIMDLTLEILGWVESLEDALTQFTSPEDLDGENMYRCGRCTAYVHARKKLSIHEAPNILTIVLKRFQEGRYGKINKCITFPEMLDMVPFMTGTGDIPPLYMLYAVVVHVDTLNASFSGHYVSYVKDLQGNWFRIDDIEVKPVSTSQVMSEGAYILFYTRSCPRPQLTFTQKAVQHQVPNSSKCYSIEESGKLSKSGHGIHVSSGPSPDTRPEILSHLNNTSNGFPSESSDSSVMQVTETHAENISRDFSDVTSSDWSLFTSSDEASFTTESTRDSFSTVDYADAGNMDPISSFFAYNSENPSIYVCHREHSYSMPFTGFIDEKGHRFKTYSSQKTDQSKMVSNPSIELPSNGNCGMYVYYGSTPMCGSIWTSS